MERSGGAHPPASRLLARPLLCLPHIVALLAVCGAGLVLSLPAALLATLTGRYPRALFEYVGGAFAWAMRLLAYFCFLTDAYPPFGLGRRSDYPARFEIAYYPDGRISRWRPALAWLTVVPQLISLFIVYASIVVMIVLSLFSIVFTGVYPANVYDFVVRALRFQAHVLAFALFLTDSYPRFEL